MRKITNEKNHQENWHWFSLSRSIGFLVCADQARQSKSTFLEILVVIVALMIVLTKRGSSSRSFVYLGFLVCVRHHAAKGHNPRCKTTSHFSENRWGHWDSSEKGTWRRVRGEGKWEDGGIFKFECLLACFLLCFHFWRKIKELYGTVWRMGNKKWKRKIGSLSSVG